jgi:hypothetical protein
VQGQQNRHLNRSRSKQKQHELKILQSTLSHRKRKQEYMQEQHARNVHHLQSRGRQSKCVLPEQSSEFGNVENVEPNFNDAVVTNDHDLKAQQLASILDGLINRGKNLQTAMDEAVETTSSAKVINDPGGCLFLSRRQMIAKLYVPSFQLARQKRKWKTKCAG